MKLISFKINARKTTCYRCQYLTIDKQPVFLKSSSQEQYYSRIRCSIFLPNESLKLNKNGNPMRNEICLKLDSE